jgi:hypothetical protein
MVRSIRKARKDGETLSALAGRFGVNKTCIHGIVAGRTWKHVPAPLAIVEPSAVVLDF